MPYNEPRFNTKFPMIAQSPHDMYYLKLVYCGLHGRIWSVPPFNACIIGLSMTSLTGSPPILESYWLAHLAVMTSLPSRRV